MTHYLTLKHLQRIERKRHSHKGENGRVVAIGGSQDFVGALSLAASAALRSGADLALVCAPEKVAWAINCLGPDLITIKLPGETLTRTHLRRIKALLRDDDVLLLGNGAGRASGTVALLRELASLPHRKVIDADGITALRSAAISNAILTPHRRELETLLKNTGATLATFSRKNIVIVKGPIDEIHSSLGVAFNRTGTSRMSVGGTGDVLAGLCAGLLAQYRDLSAAANTAAYLNGAIGERLQSRSGFGFTASDMLAEIGPALRGAGLHKVVP